MFKKLWSAIKAVFKYLSAGDTVTPKTKAYTVKRGERQDFELNAPCMVSFDITGVKPTDQFVEAHLIWAVESGKDWNGGNPNPKRSYYAASGKDYKLKCGDYGEERLNTVFSPDNKYSVELLIGSLSTMYRVKNLSTGTSEAITVANGFTGKVTVSIGWPPSKRNGAENAVITNIITTEG